MIVSYLTLPNENSIHLNSPIRAFDRGLSSKPSFLNLGNYKEKSILLIGILIFFYEVW